MPLQPPSSTTPSTRSPSSLARPTPGPWARDETSRMPTSYTERKKQFRSGRPIVSFFSAPFRPMLNCIAKLIYQLLPKAFPHNLAKGDVFDLIKLLKTTDFDAIPTPQIYNQDLAGFFTSIDTDRFLDSWRLTLQYLSSTISTNPNEIISVKPTNWQHDRRRGQRPNVSHPQRDSQDLHQRHLRPSSSCP